jgi:hypothetical protein
VLFEPANYPSLVTTSPQRSPGTPTCRCCYSAEFPQSLAPSESPVPAAEIADEAPCRLRWAVRDHLSTSICGYANSRIGRLQPPIPWYSGYNHHSGRCDQSWNILFVHFIINLTSGDIERSGCKRKRPASLIRPSATRQQSFAVSSLSQAPKMNGLCPKNNLEGLYMKLLQTPVRRPLPTRLSGCQSAAVCGCARSSARRSRNPNHA